LGLVAWEAAGQSSESFSFFFSFPSDIAATAASMLSDDIRVFGAVFGSGELPSGATPGLIWNVGVTAIEALAGFVIGNVLGTLIGVSLWFSRTVGQISKPYLVALGAVPVFAIAPMTILWFGIGFEAKVALATLATFFIAVTQSFRGAEQVDPLLVRRFQVFGASQLLVFRRLILPSALVWIFSSLRLTVGAALLGAFIGEFIASDQGIGRVIVRASGLYDTPRVLVGVISIVLVALTLDALVSRLEKRHAWFATGG
jgi:NitT/TauT family transport system permease protein